MGRCSKASNRDSTISKSVSFNVGDDGESRQRASNSANEARSAAQSEDFNVWRSSMLSTVPGEDKLRAGSAPYLKFVEKAQMVEPEEDPQGYGAAQIPEPAEW